MGRLFNQSNGVLLVIVTLCLAVGLVTAAELPKGWFVAGSNSKDYQIGIDTTIKHSGKSSGMIQSKVAAPTGFGTLMQMCQANEYLGKRVRLSAYVKSKDIADWAGVWFRVDGPQAKPLAFDNMQKRPIKGTTDWQKYEIILDIPQEAVNLGFGILLQGKGQAWIDDIKFESVTKDVPVTAPLISIDKEKEPQFPPAPISLDFE
jgi:hypothetical protein